MLALLFALQAVTGTAGPPGSLGDLDNRYCLETGYCRSPADGYPTPPSGLLFLAVGVAAAGGWLLKRKKATGSPAADSA